jgi:hypothetical protein
VKTYFNGHGYRHTKIWSCSNCRNYTCCGMDLFVDESVESHRKICPPPIIETTFRLLYDREGRVIGGQEIRMMTKEEILKIWPNAKITLDN